MTPSQRRRSIDSSSSSSEPSSSAHNPSQSEKQMIDPSLEGEQGATATGAQTSSAARGDHEPPPSYTASAPGAIAVPVGLPQKQQVPPSGYRIPLSSPGGPPFPGVERTRGAPFTDADGTSPVFIGSAILQYSVHPCKIAPNQPRPCYVSYGGEEIVHEGRYDLLPFVPEHMEFVSTSGGRIPPGRRPVKGGFEHDGKELYHAVAFVEGIKVPGKTGVHLNGCRIPYNGEEHIMDENYEILCWKF